MAKKIGILTFHRSFNYGAVLQAYALQNKLKKVCEANDIKASVEIIDYDSSEHRRATYIHSGVIAKRIWSIPKNIIKVQNISRFQKNNLCLTKKRLVTDDLNKAVEYVNSLGFDLIVSGSDEIWRVNRGLPFPSLYWLPDNVRTKKVSYAPSANRTLFSGLNEKQRRAMNNCLLGYDVISVRDEYTQKSLKKIIGEEKEIEICPDPTFSLEIPECSEKLNRLLEKKKIGTSGKPVIGLVGLRKDIAEEVVKRFGMEYEFCAMVSQCKSVSFLNTISPLEWAAVFRKFDCCITGLFHGTIFSLKNKTPFISFEQELHYTEFESKIKFLLRQAGLQDRLWSFQKEGWDYDALKLKVDSMIAGDTFDYDAFLSEQNLKTEIFLSKVINIMK